MLTAVVSQTGSSFSVELLGAANPQTWLAAEVQPPEKDLNPIFPEMKEVAWGFGSFVVLALLMRFVLFPKLKQGMDARYNGIRADHEQADADRAAARAEVAAYEAELASVKAEAAGRLDAVRQQLEAERQEKITALNARLAEARAAAAADAERARAAADGQIRAAVSDVASRVGELAIGRRPKADVVDSAVSEVMAK